MTHPKHSVIPFPTYLPLFHAEYIVLREQDLFGKLKEGMDPGFRLFITALPNNEFPLGLLQMCTKVCARRRGALVFRMNNGRLWLCATRYTI